MIHPPLQHLADTVTEEFKAVFGNRGLGTEADFFQLGGDSLQAARLLARIAAVTGKQVPFSILWQNPTPGGLAAWLEDAPLLETPKDLPYEREALSSQEENFWLLHQTARDPAVYNTVLALELRGPLDPARLARAIEHWSTDHPIYRTRFREEGARLVRAVDDAPVTLAFHPVGGAEEDFPAACDRFLRGEFARPFDLSAESPVRVHLFTHSAAYHLIGFVVHHIAGDGISMETLWSSVVRHYEALARGESAHRDPPSAHYLGFRARQARARAAATFARDQAYWLDRLADRPLAPAFPEKLPDPPGTPDPLAPSEALIDLPQRLHEAVRARAAEWHCTANTLFLAAYFLWLRFYTGSDELIVGQPTSGRQHPEDFGVQGCCINMLPIRHRLPMEATFKDFAQALQGTVTEAMDHATVHFLEVVKRLGEGTAGGGDVFNTTLQYRNFMHGFEALGPCAARHLHVSHVGAQFPLMVEIYAYQRRAEISMTFDKSRFGRQQVAAMLAHYRHLLEQLLASPRQRLRAISILTLAETAQRETWEKPLSPYRREASVPTLFREQVVRAPAAIALQTDAATLTYGELDARSDRWAAALQAEGVIPGDRVGLGIERGIELIVAMLAVLKAGAVYVPLDLEYPNERLDFMIRDAELRCTLSTAASLGRFLSHHAPTLLVESFDASPHPLVPVDPGPESAAYLIYTSGSTGEPKGSLIPHRGIVRLVNGTDYVELGPEQTHLFLASPSFDAATFEIWGALLNGGRLAIMPPITPALADLGQALDRFGVTTLWLTAGLFHVVVDEAPQILGGLRQLLAGGDVLSPERVRQFRAAYPAVRLINGYGPTENTTFSCCYTVPAELPAIASLPIGRCIANSEATILNDDLQRVPVGVRGELYLGGDGLSLGYWRRPALDASAFLADPLAEEAGRRLYRTGDFARFLPDGNIEFFGRRDGQLKIRGFRVEIGEVEECLRGIEGVRQCAVVPRAEKPGHSLSAHLVGPALASGELARIQHEARRRLPAYMLPSHWQVLPALPLTANGKVDRPALARHGPGGEPSIRPEDLPQTPMEIRIHEIWTRLFERDTIGLHASFLDLGGHSLLAIRVIGEIERLLGVRLPVNRVLQYPTIHALAASIEDEQARRFPASIVPLKEEGAGAPLFMVHGIGGDVFWFLDLVRALELDCPVLGIQSTQNRPDETAARSLEELAAGYVEDLLKFAPQGGIALCGYSIGGLIAYEIGRQLTARGVAPREIFVIDTHPGFLPLLVTLRMRLSYLRFRLWHHARIWLQGPHRVAYFRGRVRALCNHFARQPQTEAGPHGAGLGLDRFERLAASYRPAKSTLPVTVISARDSGFNLEPAWRYLVGPQFRLIETAGDHLDVFRGRHLRQFADRFSAHLAARSRD